MYKCKSYRGSELLCAAVLEVSKKKRDELKGLWPKREREEFTAKSHWQAPAKLTTTTTTFI